ncbi:MAG: molybdopterin converting factor subunit 1 [Polyangiaceae bacterium]
MKLSILYFAMTRDLVGLDSEVVEVDDSIRTIGEISSWLERHHNALAGRMKGIRLARNEAFASHDELLTEGDTIALIPPVSGGE